MLFLSAYGHKTMFESNRTRPAFRAAFAEYSLKAATERVDDSIHPGRIIGAVILLKESSPTARVTVTGWLISTP